jgi:hypothetical protein
MSDTRDFAAELCRGTIRLLAQQGFPALTEVSLANDRRADILALGRNGELRIIEIKSSPTDFRTDRKWPDYRDFCDRFYFAVGAQFDETLIPRDCGLIRADAWGAALIREATLTALSAPRRRAVTLRFALVASLRLSHLLDPEFFPEL